MLKLDYCTHEAAKYAVENWHYSRCMPVGKLIKIGVWEDSEYKGAVIFGRGANKSLLAPYGLKQTEGCELVRIALKQHDTPVTRIVKIAISMIKKDFPSLKLIISYADTGQGHEGKIYKAGNWIYQGLIDSGVFYKKNGKTYHKRSFASKYGSTKNHDDIERIKMKPKHKFVMPIDKRLKQAMAVQQHSGGVAPT